MENTNTMADFNEISYILTDARIHDRDIESSITFSNSTLISTNKAFSKKYIHQLRHVLGNLIQIESSGQCYTIRNQNTQLIAKKADSILDVISVKLDRLYEKYKKPIFYTIWGLMVILFIFTKTSVNPIWFGLMATVSALCFARSTQYFNELCYTVSIKRIDIYTTLKYISSSFIFSIGIVDLSLSYTPILQYLNIGIYTVVGATMLILSTCLYILSKTNNSVFLVA